MQTGKGDYAFARKFRDSDLDAVVELANGSLENCVICAAILPRSVTAESRLRIDRRGIFTRGMDFIRPPRITRARPPINVR